MSCVLGLLNVQVFSGLEPNHIVLGEIVDPASGKTAFGNLFTDPLLVQGWFSRQPRSWRQEMQSWSPRWQKLSNLKKNLFVSWPKKLSQQHYHESIFIILVPVILEVLVGGDKWFYQSEAAWCQTPVVGIFSSGESFCTGNEKKVFFNANFFPLRVM